MTMLTKQRPRQAPFVRKAFYSPDEIARLLGVSKQTILNRIRDGQLIAVRVSPRVYRVPLGGLMRFLRPDAPSRTRWIVEPEAKIELDEFDREMSQEHHGGRRG